MRNIILLIITLSFLSIDSVWAKDNEHEIFKDSCYVKSKDEWYKLRADFNLPNSPTLWNAISQQLFHKETPSADSAYTKYIHSFAEMKDMKKFIQTKEREINLSAKCTSHVPGLYMNITAKYHKQWNEKKFLSEVVKEKNFIYDVQKDKVLTIRDVFSTSKVNDIETYAADSLTYYMLANNSRVLLIYTKKDKYGNSTGLPKKTEILQYTKKAKLFSNDFKNLIGFNGNEYSGDDTQEKIIYKKETTRILIRTSTYQKVELDERDLETNLMNGLSNTTAGNLQYQIPEFNGGSKGLSAYIADNFKYPDEGWKNQAFGKLELIFDVEPHGSIGNIEITRSLDEAVDKEAVRVIKEMPNWKPGRQNGFSFIVKCTMIIDITPTFK